MKLKYMKLKYMKLKYMKLKYMKLQVAHILSGIILTLKVSHSTRFPRPLFMVSTVEIVSISLLNCTKFPA